MTNFQALNTLTIYSNISRISLLIQITLCRNARIQMDISKKNRFSAEKAINYFPSHWEKKKGTNMWNAWVLRVFLLSHASNFINRTKDNSIQRQLYDPFIIKLELLCQCEMTSWYYIATKSSIVDNLLFPDRSLVCFFFVRKINSSLTLNRWVPVTTCCIDFHKNRSSHPEMFFKKGVLRIFRQFKGENPCNSST